MPAEVGVAVVTPPDGVVNVHAHMRTHTGARFGPVIPRDLPQAVGQFFFFAAR